jgi:carbohydrate-binding DOMON domain-containing protein
MNRLAGLLLILTIGCAGAAEQHVATLVDPSGDDVGDGTLLYPTGGVLQPGDLDLRSLRIDRDDQGYWFTATFANFIHESWWSPKGETAGEYSKQGQNRLPFSFNIDLYIDTDRKSGSGQLFTLPGRKARIDRRYAWERGVFLSPRPKTVRDKLLEKLRQSFPGRPEKEAEASVDETMYFVGKRQLLDKAIIFYVPRAFMGPSDPANWAITAFVTVAAPVVDANDLGVMQLANEPSPGALGHVATHIPPPMVDVLVPSTALQYKLLSSALPLTGYSLSRDPADEDESKYDAESFRSRLIGLKESFERKLIDEATYQAQRRKILDEL